LDIREWRSDAVTIKVDYGKCVAHGNCVEACPSDVYELQNGKAVPVGIDDCIECCACVESCPEKAIEHSACE
jgi:NAD-dependent dihydropyrimidine dehydrogenase PreA subunit